MKYPIFTWKRSNQKGEKGQLTYQREVSVDMSDLVRIGRDWFQDSPFGASFLMFNAPMGRLYRMEFTEYMDGDWIMHYIKRGLLYIEAPKEEPNKKLKGLNAGPNQISLL